MNKNLALPAIGIFGGTFDPVHNGHLQVATTLQQIGAVEKIWFVPCQQNVLKTGKPQASNEQRVHLLKLAIAGHANFKVDTRELQRAPPSYMTDTIDAIRAEVANPLYLIMSSDVFAAFLLWKDWQHILTQTSLLVTTRNDYPSYWSGPLQALVDTHQVESLAEFKSYPCAKILFVSLPQPIAISSTAIRAGIKMDQDMSPYLPLSVWDCIKQNHLYSNNVQSHFT